MEISFSDRVIFAGNHFFKGVRYRFKNIYGSIVALDRLSSGDMEQWSYTRQLMKDRKKVGQLHIKVARAAIFVK